MGEDARAGASGSRSRSRAIARLILALFYAGAGIVHLRTPDPFLLITPDWVPYPREVILATGLCELFGALGLMLPATRRLAGLALAAYAVCVFPANIKHMVDGIVVPGLPNSLWYHVPRMLLQPVLVWLALWTGDVIDWPFRRNPD